MFVACEIDSYKVALYAEGVGRNFTKIRVYGLEGWSPSTRRAWVEIRDRAIEDWNTRVALYAEGVGRNAEELGKMIGAVVALYAVGVGRNTTLSAQPAAVQPSPSTRRAWVEIRQGQWKRPLPLSPSTRRAWVEILARYNLTPNRAGGRPLRGGRG